jgi:hypothetical protein
MARRRVFDGSVNKLFLIVVALANAGEEAAIVSF